MAGHMIDKGQWRKEHELLLLCTQAPFDDGKRARFDDLLDDPLDWEFLIETSYAHAVTPLLCRTLELATELRVPGDVLAAARTHLEDARSRNQKLTQELLRILNGLERAGIPAIPFKGPVLAELYYGDPGLRHYRDLDFLVAGDAAAETVAVLRALDYTGSGQVSSRDSSFSPTLRQDAALWRYAGEYIFFHSDKSIAIEPHWAFIPPTFGLDLDYTGVWARARQGALSDQTILTLSPEDTVMSLALHGSKEYWTRLQWIADFDRAVTQERDVDWGNLIDNCRRQGALRLLLVGLQIVHTLFGTALDPRVSVAIDDDRWSQILAANRIESLFNANPALHSNAILSLDWVRMLHHPGDKIRYLFRTIMTPRVQHFEMARLPDGLFPLYHGIKLAHDYVALPLWIAAKTLKLVKRTP